MRLMCVNGSGVPAASKSHVAIRPVRSSSPKAGSSHIDNEKTVVEGQLLRVHNDSDSDDQVNTSLDTCQHHHLLRNEENNARNIRTNTTSIFKLSQFPQSCTGREERTAQAERGKKVLQMPIISVFPNIMCLMPCVRSSTE